MKPFETKLAQWQAAVEAFLSRQFTGNYSYGVLLEAMRYSLLSGGKRLRPVFCMAFAEAVGGSSEEVLPAACAIEMVHTYSLIHDDLPCMDNDDYRRGRLTNHKVYGYDTALLAGDALLTAAFEILSGLSLPPDKILRCVSLLASGAGEHGMVAGQILDLAGEEKTLSISELREVHRHKTGDLIRASCQIGAVLGGGSEKQIEAAGEFALHLGMAFQIRDDMLDVIGSQTELGKPVGSDAENGKSTFVTLCGLTECQRLVEEETEMALTAFHDGGFSETAFLDALARSLTERTK